MDRSSRKKFNKETLASNDILYQAHLADTDRRFHPKAADYTFFSNAHGTFSGIDHMLGHRTNLTKFEKTEIISRIFCDHNTMRLK